MREADFIYKIDHDEVLTVTFINPDGSLVFTPRLDRRPFVASGGGREKVEAEFKKLIAALEAAWGDFYAQS
jgi:hypothetical protein